MTIKMFVNSQYSQIGSLSYKIQLLMQSVLFEYLYFLQDTMQNTVEKTEIFGWGSKTYIARQNTL